VPVHRVIGGEGRGVGHRVVDICLTHIASCVKSPSLLEYLDGVPRRSTSTLSHPFAGTTHTIGLAEPRYGTKETGLQDFERRIK
jgi:hypothetical protein